MDEVSTVLGGAASASSLLKDIREYVKKRRSSEILEKVTELQVRHIEMLEVQDQLREESRRLREENQELKAQAAARADLEWENNVYWKREGSDRIGPFCPKCLDGDAKQVRMTVGRDCWHCLVCNTTVNTPERVGELQRARENRQQLRGQRGERSWLDARR